MGRRVKKAVYAYGSGGWELQKEILFVYDGWNLIHEKEVSGTGDPLFEKFYVWGLDLSQSIQGAGGIGGLLAMVDNGKTYHYFYDRNGNVGQLVNAAKEEIAAHYEFDPFGNTVYQSGSMADGNPFRHSTKYFDSETGLVYNDFRYYSPDLGRWLTRDPIEEQGFLVLTFSDYYGSAEPNLYVFVLNDPLNSYDAHGLAVETGWDLFNVGTGVLSLACNISSGNVLGAVIDVGGLAYDITATAVPFLPGGASAGIKAIRLANASKGLAKAMMVEARAAKSGKTLIRYVLTKGDEAHHLIAQTAKKAKFARDKLKSMGIDIHDAVNGVSLPRGSHRHLHTDDYYRRINRAAESWNSKQDAINDLQKIAEELLRQTGKLK